VSRAENRARAVDLAVVGGGVIGLAIAWRAAARGLSVTLLERGQAGGGTSSVAAGMLAPIAEVTPGEEPLLELGRHSASAYPRFVAELIAAAAVDGVGYTPIGTLLVARDADEAQALDRELELRRRYDLVVDRLRASEARRLEPGLAPALRMALHVPEDHAVDPRPLARALLAATRAAGGRVSEQTLVARLDVEHPDDSRARVTGVTLRDGLTVGARNVVIAAGVWSDRLQGIPPSARIPIAPVKGQILRLHDPGGPGLLTRVIRMGSSYIVPRGDGRYVIGATSEERGFDTTVTAGAAFELLRDAGELVPGVSELVLDEFQAGLRPGTPDNLPVIGPTRAVEGLYWATGHRRSGILLAPATAELIVAALEGRVDERAAAFAPERLTRAAARSAA